MAYWREASTVILVAKSDSAERLSHLQFDYEVLLLKRGSALKFHSEQYVYPGGVVSTEDFDPKWAELFTKISQCSIEDVSVALSNESKFPPILREDPESTIPRNIALRITAIRETFEEAGVALVVSKPRCPSQHNTHQGFSMERTQLEAWRKKVIADPGMFIKMCEHFDVLPDVWSLVEWVNWLTPVMKPVNKPPKKPMRFDTMFFLCCTEHKPNVFIDGVENTDCQWFTPESLIWKRSQGEIVCGDPQAIESLRMYNYLSLGDLWQFSVRRAMNFAVERFLVVIISCADGIITVHPHDDCYPQHPDIEGFHGVLSTPKTVAETRASCRYLNRIERTQESTSNRHICNLPEHKMCGHKLPADVTIVVSNIQKCLSAKL
ncbi:hypothetical protein CAPTEDRAFT_173988 [Capitella teleta]|uniref:Nudix hydrolase domain-containing protein n=1 Tax=Capitella teleta TaxID=283909 RepID=R7T6D5_CAPTE|nr:hypothetical protein CAPTEDRAFT_173988 [Capitella teleta]|eukprot:ELT89114.1 hypothetical protein CAPTEDRAFT_173988 [Capitella teleta]